MTQANVAATTNVKGEKEPWNGEFYVSFGDDDTRSWSEAMAYGFISAGGGSWYTRTLKLLSEGDRVWVNIPQTGYVGVGRVLETAQISSDFTVMTPDGERPCHDVLAEGDRYRRESADPTIAEYFVRVEWLNTVPRPRAVKETGFFGNQNTVCRPMTPAWRHTVERLKEHFPDWDALPG